MNEFQTITGTDPSAQTKPTGIKRQAGAWQNRLYMITLAFFVLGLFNIAFAWLGFLCMLIPFVLLFRDRKKTWCQGVCPRANLYQRFLTGRSLTGRRTPDWLVRGNAKWIMLGYFLLSLFIMTMSTIMVFKGNRAPIESVRLLIAFRLPWQMPQLIDVGPLTGWASHLSYRIYSMMLTTTLIGFVMGWLYKPRTWCAVCPVNTLSDAALKRIRR